MTKYCREHVVLFSLRSTNPVVLDHVDRGHAAVICEQGYIAVLESDHLIPVARVDDIPITLRGRADFNMQNALAATAAAYARGVDVDEIRRALLSFLPSPLQTPGRLNLMTIAGVDYLLDYAHNPHAYKSLVQLVGDSARDAVSSCSMWSATAATRTSRRCAACWRRSSTPPSSMRPRTCAAVRPAS